MSTIREVLRPYMDQADVGGAEAVDWQKLEADLIAREDYLADRLREAGAAYGAMPEFVAAVIVDIGLGTPPDETTRAFIKAQHDSLLAHLMAEHPELFRRPPENDN